MTVYLYISIVSLTLAMTLIGYAIYCARCAGATTRKAIWLWYWDFNKYLDAWFAYNAYLNTQVQSGKCYISWQEYVGGNFNAPHIKTWQGYAEIRVSYNILSGKVLSLQLKSI